MTKDTEPKETKEHANIISAINSDPAMSRREKKDAIRSMNEDTDNPKSAESQVFFSGQLTLASLGKDHAFYELSEPVTETEIGTIKLPRRLLPDDPDFNSDFMHRKFDQKKERKQYVKQAFLKRYLSLRMTIQM